VIAIPDGPIRHSLARPLLSAGDLLLIESLPDDVRGAVDRYVASVGAPPVSGGDGGNALYDAYRAGFEDGAQETADSVSPAYPPRELPKDWKR
jgi:hypothetical protein